MRKKNGKFRVTVIGGGTGLSSLLRGLKKAALSITAIVTVSDDGGSSGALRRELGVLPPGDIRNCLVALSEEENLMSKLFQYRFSGGGPLSGHSFGNLFLTAISSVTGGFDCGIERSSRVLAVRGRVLPVTLRSVQLEAKLESGRIVRGESNITKANSRIANLTISPSAPPAGPKVLEAIRESDALIVGPGSLFTSIVSNFLVSGMAQAIKKAKCPKIYICNIMTQPGETNGYALSDHMNVLKRYIGENVFDFVVTNSGKIPKKIAKRYEAENSFPVKTDVAGYGSSKVIKADILSRYEYARHDPDKLAKVILKILGKKQAS
ncbi:MAG: YvcK family protein [Elusimicrobiota bacterium]